MTCYGGMDVSARDGHVCVIDEARSRLVQQQGRTELSGLLRRLEPATASWPIVVESPCTGYGLVAGLQEADDDVGVAQTRGRSMITGAKVKTDRRDAWALATRLNAGMIPQASISPKDTLPSRCN
jgi:hypothetical protein